jgi:flagellar motor switch protein FliG
MLEVETYEQLSGIEKSAILLNVLGNRLTAEIFKHLRDNDVKRVVTVMGQVGKVPIPIVKQILDDFYVEISEE